MEASSFKIRFGYALPAFALAIIGIPVYVYIPKFYTDVVGIDIAVAGVLLFGVRIFDAVTDPVMGTLSDRTRTRFGRRRPFILVGSIFIAVALIFLFNPPAMTTTWNTVWFAFWIYALFLFWTLVTVPYESLDQAEADMLATTAARADLADGIHILELGCGWGSLTLYNAAHYPNSQITAVSNSASQRQFIQARCHERGLDKVQVITADMNDFSIDRRFDRIVSVEMFEHMRNWALLLARIDTWLKDSGRVFIHIFTRRQYAYPFETDGDDNWMGRFFFTGGMMPSDDLIFNFQHHLAVEKRWRVNGRHYQKTADAWLANMDARRKAILPVLAGVYGTENAALWFQRWRIFFMACSELWGYADGRQWLVSHYRLKKASDGS